MSATIKYNGSPIVTIVGGQKAVLGCKGIKMNDDIEVSCDSKFDAALLDLYDGSLVAKDEEIEQETETGG